MIACLRWSQNINLDCKLWALSSKQPILTSRYYMKRSIVFFMLGAFLVVFPNTSMTMYSIEYGKIYTESYNPIHLLSSPNPSDSIPYQQYDDSLPASENCKHFHVIPLDSLTLFNGGGVNHDIKILAISSPFFFQSNPHVFPIVPSPDFFTKFKILTGGHLSLRKSTVLLI